MNNHHNLDRFISAQKHDYQSALEQVQSGKKTGHWMWYIFPQIAGLGHSETSRFFAISGLEEATAYLNHPVLGRRMIEISNALLDLAVDDPLAIFGSVDSLKLKSSMTLFSLVPSHSPVFQKVLDKYFGGQKDNRTMQIVNKSQ